ncbi:MAG TPA: molybdenum cofactor biosynthesis protein MoaE [candidate division Zixibacteria bacterium]|nr:molybdenum cofactor biosynthesis protein MoaE [candidate division Zixibacteria bacterium]
MRITVRTFAQLRDLSADRLVLELPVGSRLADAWAVLAERYPAVEPHRPHVLAARNAAHAGWDEPLVDGDEVAFLPPVSGGGFHGLTDGPIDVAALERAVAGSGHGAVVTFVGRARDTADDGRTVLELEYEAYPEMAESVLAEIAREAEARWPGTAVAVVHRLGVVAIGEAAVAIVTASAHRSAAYEANRHVIEAIKRRLPIWKRERFADGSEWKRPGA